MVLPASIAIALPFGLSDLSEPFVARWWERRNRMSCCGLLTLTSVQPPRLHSSAGAFDACVGSFDRFDGDHCSVFDGDRLSDIHTAHLLGDLPSCFGVRCLLLLGLWVLPIFLLPRVAPVQSLLLRVLPCLHVRKRSVTAMSKLSSLASRLAALVVQAPACECRSGQGSA